MSSDTKTDPTSPSFAEIAGASPVSEAALTPVHSNYVPAQIEKHLEFLDFNSHGDLLIGASSLTTRYWTGSIWCFKKGVTENDAINPARCITGLDIGTGVIDGHFIRDKQSVIGLDSGGVVLMGLTKEQDGDSITYYLEQQAEVMEHDDMLTGINTWKDGSIASVGLDNRLNIISPTMALVNSYQPVHSRFVSGVSCSQTLNVVATCSLEGAVRIWDSRQPKPARSVGELESEGCGSLEWCDDQNLIVGSMAGDLVLLDIRGKEKGLRFKFMDRPITRMKWSPERNMLAVAGDDVTTIVVRRIEGQLKTVMQDSLHSDYVRGLSWVSSDNLWSVGWDHKVKSRVIGECS